MISSKSLTWFISKVLNQEVNMSGTKPVGFHFNWIIGYSHFTWCSVEFQWSLKMCQHI